LVGNQVTRFNRLYDQHKNALYRYLNFLTRNTAESEDLFQETWLRVAKHMQKLDHIEKVKPWIFTIATNLHRDSLRKKKIRQMFIRNLDRGDCSPHLPLKSVQRDPAEKTEREQAYQDVMQALGNLPEKIRQVVVLREIEGFSYEEIAVTLGLSSGTVKSRMHRAIKKIRREMDFLESASKVFSGDLA
jgi:RNA polymerase sigma-70 factor (ECF subfamily)